MSKYRGAGDELEPEREQERREWEESKHPRNPKGTPQGGQFINIALFASNYKNMTVGELDRSIKSHSAQIQKHQEKIKNPALYVSNWEERSAEYKAGMVARWNNEIKNFEKQIKMAEDEKNGRK